MSDDPSDWAADVTGQDEPEDFEKQLVAFVDRVAEEFGIPVEPPVGSSVVIREPADQYPVVTFKVGGQAAPQGSKVSGVTKSGIGYSREANKRLPQWRTDVAAAATAVMDGHPLLEGSLSLEAVFVFPRPKSHYTSRGSLTKSAALVTAPTSHTLGDLSKLVRAVEDAMSKVVYLDDSQITTCAASKRWGIAAATYITVQADPLLA